MNVIFMHISWLGQTCIKLQTKYRDEDITVLIDGYKPSTGEFPRSFSPQIALFSHGQEEAASVGNAFIMDTLGECELKEVMVTSLPSTDGTAIFKINAEGLSVAHLGNLHKKPDVTELEKLGSIDILLIPVGGNKQYLEPADAAELITALEPRIVIPIAYQCDSDKAALPVSSFIKESGLKPEVTDKKVIIKKKDLPQDETKLYILEKNV